MLFRVTSREEYSADLPWMKTDYLRLVAFQDCRRKEAMARIPDSDEAKYKNIFL